ncbi:segregation and condensation protein B [Natronobacillus azotifigens]|uniref:Segregation and condensation protein B n=1 Tax=Natronobacillus azotifigens TaxID=472978 RepID=A0A9J6R976_9BACI|nr:SMC-Scp complex subunit ScpB [Natronobacillus azotifigens]
MNLNEYKAILEGLLFAAGTDGLTIKQVSNVLDIDYVTVRHIIDELKYDYERTDRGINMIESEEIFYLATKPEYASYFKKLLAAPQASKLSQASLETLAIVAYNQPITRVEVEEIRGVKSDRPIQTLVSRALIEEVGRKEGVGRPMMFGTTIDFLTYFGLKSIDELPPLLEDFDDINIEQEADLFLSNRNQDSDNAVQEQED